METEFGFPFDDISTRRISLARKRQRRIIITWFPFSFSTAFPFMATATPSHQPFSKSSSCPSSSSPSSAPSNSHALRALRPHIPHRFSRSSSPLTSSSSNSSLRKMHVASANRNSSSSSSSSSSHNSPLSGSETEKERESDAQCWERMLGLQKLYHCYNSARLEAAVEALENGWGIEMMSIRECLFSISDFPFYYDNQVRCCWSGNGQRKMEIMEYKLMKIVAPRLCLDLLDEELKARMQARNEDLVF